MQLKPGFIIYFFNVRLSDKLRTRSEFYEGRKEIIFEIIWLESKTGLKFECFAKSLKSYIKNKNIRTMCNAKNVES